MDVVFLCQFQLINKIARFWAFWSLSTYASMKNQCCQLMRDRCQLLRVAKCTDLNWHGGKTLAVEIARLFQFTPSDSES